MSFLARLVERHRTDGATSVPRLEPRLPSRFEPVALSPAPEHIGSDVAADGAREAVAPVVPAVTPPPPRADAGPLEHVHVTRLVSALAAARGTVEAPPLRKTSAAPAIVAPPRADTSRALAPDSSPAHAGVRPTPALPAARHSSQTVAELPAHRPAPRAARAIDVEGPHIAPSSSPTVHVSIGRIDVRAIATSAAPPRVRPPTPASGTSLEDYLRGRAR